MYLDVLLAFMRHCGYFICMYTCGSMLSVHFRARTYAFIYHEMCVNSSKKVNLYENCISV